MSKSTKSVLLVDDEKFIQQSFADYLEDQLWQVFRADSGEQALELLVTESPDCAIVDIRMGGMDGITFIREAFKEKPNMSFIICTGSPEFKIPEDLEKLRCVSNQIFQKPVTDLESLENSLIQSIEAMNNE